MVALTWRVCSFWNVLRFFWCSKDTGCHPVGPAWRGNFFCIPKEITRTSSRGLQHPTIAERENKRQKFVWNFQHSTYLMSLPHSPFYVINNYSDVNSLQVILLCLWGIYLARAVSTKCSQVQHKHCQPASQWTRSLWCPPLLWTVITVSPEKKPKTVAVCDVPKVTGNWEKT